MPEVPRFYEDAALDNAWRDIARKEVNEPEEEEEVAAKLEKLRASSSPSLKKNWTRSCSPRQI